MFQIILIADDCMPTFEELGIVKQPKECEYALADKRYQSFLESPFNNEEQVINFVDAGFYYSGFGDFVKCFFCGLCVGQWNIHDCPYGTHKDCAKDCGYIQNVKSEMFFKVISSTSTHIIFRNVSRKSSKIKSHFRDSSIRTLLECGVGSIQQLKEFINHDINNMSSIDVYKFVDPDYKTENKSEVNELTSKIEEIKSKKLCLICVSNPADTICFPCGHMNICFHCSLALKKCCLCRSPIKGRFRISESITPIKNKIVCSDKGLSLLKTELCFLEKSLKCLSCGEKNKNVVNFPCGHYVSCEDCSLNVKVCKFCDQKLLGFTVIFH